MEPASLGIGVAALVGLFSTCLDIVEKWDSYKGFGVESASLIARLTADRVRFKQWGRSVGISGPEENSPDRHVALDDPSVQAAVDLVLQSIQNLDKDANKFTEKPAYAAPPRGDPMPTAPSRGTRVSWALRGKARLLDLVASFESLVQKLYDLVPPALTTKTDPTISGDGDIALSS